VAGVIADVFGLAAAMWTVALLTLASGLWAQQRLCETLRRA